MESEGHRIFDLIALQFRFVPALKNIYYTRERR
jgi:hypothetical protein